MQTLLPTGVFWMIGCGLYARVALAQPWARRPLGPRLKLKGDTLAAILGMNPLKRKLVDHPKDWPWSSFSFYSNLKHGLIRVDPIH
jgi:hypothetical protein